MSDLISREAVLNLVLPWCADDDGSVGKIGDLREVLDDIENLPSVEAVPLSVIEDIKAEIEELGIWHEKLLIETIDIKRVLEIIDEAVKECTHEL